MTQCAQFILSQLLDAVAHRNSLFPSTKEFSTIQDTYIVKDSKLFAVSPVEKTRTKAFKFYVREVYKDSPEYKIAFCETPLTGAPK